MDSRTLVLGLSAAAVLLLTGCASDEVRQMRATPTAGVDSSRFVATSTLCRKVGRKSGRRIGVGSDFRMGKKSYVRAFVDFANVVTDRDYTVHLVWIRPDGRELFRKYALVRQGLADTDEHRWVLTWLDAEDLHKVRVDTLRSAGPNFTLGTRLNTSLRKKRDPGLYRFRVYLDRALLLEDSFTLRGPAVPQT